MSKVTEVIKIRRRVLAEIARMTFAGTLQEDIRSVLQVVSESGPRYRCCIHKERAVLKERINLALNQPLQTKLEESAANALAGQVADLPIITVLPEACDQCPIDKFMVTDACRNCVAHNCITRCPRKAIMIVNNRAYIDQSLCIECGMCKRSCPYSAIIEISRPCERACDLGAINAGSDRRATIDESKCVDCGACKIACPFGAIDDRSYLVQMITALKDPSKRVYAILAPAFIGQFGPKLKHGQVMSAIKRLGFHEVVEVSYGADITTIEETREFIETVPSQRSFMTTSCCPAFVDLIEKHLPELKENMSTAFSPMLCGGSAIKNNDPEALVAFIGPCIAKKREAARHPGIIDFVLTFEEMASVLDGMSINIADEPDPGIPTIGSHDGNAFAIGGGLVQAVAGAIGHLGANIEFYPERREGMENCKIALKEIKNGTLEANFFEGMSCTGGCVGGPGTLIDTRVATRMVDMHSKTAAVSSSQGNAAAAAEIPKGNWHHKH